MKSKKRIVKKVIFGILIAIAVFIAVNIIVTEVYASKIPHHFASAKEGRELILSNEFYNNYSQNDLNIRLEKTDATLDEFLDNSTESVKSFNIFEKFYIDSRLANMARSLDKNGYSIPEIDTITFVKRDMSVEFGCSGYTHENEIYLNSSLIFGYTLMSIDPQTDNLMEELLWHEMFHVITRYNPEFRSQMYSLINFTVTDSDYVLPSSVSEYMLCNPDVEHHDSYATFVIDGQNVDCFMAYVSTGHFTEGEAIDDIAALVPVDGSDTYYTSDQASNFDDVFGTNTSYVIDPEECMADNFSFALTYGIEGKDTNGYPNPEIISGVIDALK